MEEAGRGVRVRGAEGTGVGVRCLAGQQRPLEASGPRPRLLRVGLRVEMRKSMMGNLQVMIKICQSLITSHPWSKDTSKNDVTMTTDDVTCNC